MSVLVRATFESGKVKYIRETESQKRQIEILKQFALDNEKKTIYKEFFAEDELNFEKNLLLYYEKIILPALYPAMKSEYGLTSMSDCDATLSAMFLSKTMVKLDKTEYKIHRRMKDISFQDQADFLAKIANIAITKYSLRFPSAVEIQKSNLI